MLISQITTPSFVPTRQLFYVCISIILSLLLKPEADRQVSISGRYNSVPQISAVPELSLDCFKPPGQFSITPNSLCKITFNVSFLL